MTSRSGEVLIDGRRCAATPIRASASLGLVPQDLALYEELTAPRQPGFFGALYGLGPAALAAAISKDLELVGLADRAKIESRPTAAA